jgi:hypothetical protein
MRRILNQAANAAVKLKGSIFEILYRRYVPRLGHKHTIGIIAHKLCRLIWKILHLGVRYEERGPEVSKMSKQRRTKNDPRTPQTRLPDRTDHFPTSDVSLVADFRPWLFDLFLSQVICAVGPGWVFGMPHCLRDSSQFQFKDCDLYHCAGP